jgi:hypothetical protein
LTIFSAVNLSNATCYGSGHVYIDIDESVAYVSATQASCNVSRGRRHVILETSNLKTLIKGTLHYRYDDIALKWLSLSRGVILTILLLIMDHAVSKVEETVALKRN